MILSASRRTDIPSFYSDWILNRLQEGYVLTQNPMNPRQISRVSLSPDTVDCIVFWTKDPAPMLSKLDILDAMGYHYYFQFTLTPYDRSIERNLRSKAELEDTFRALSKRLGRNRVVWRYDPILYTDRIDMAYHKAEFTRMCSLFADCTDTVVVSFVDLYRKLHNPVFYAPSDRDQQELAAFIGETARRFGIRAAACCENADLFRYGIERSSCIDPARIASIIGNSIAAKPDKNQRSGCGCIESIDVGIYDTCKNGCIYCYANRNPQAETARFASHDPMSPLLWGVIPENAVIRERKIGSQKEIQLWFD